MYAREHRLDLGAVCFVLPGKHEASAETLQRLIHSEPGRVRRDLEQDPARLPEIHRVEVLAVDDRRGLITRRFEPAPQRQLRRIVRDGPRHVMHGPGTRLAGNEATNRAYVDQTASAPIPDCESARISVLTDGAESQCL